MKLLTLALFAAGFAFGQAVYIEPPPAVTVAGNPPAGSFPSLLAASGARITVCSYPSCAALTQTYTDATAGTPCPTNTQVVIAGTSTCTNAADSRGNFGFWVLTGGQYEYKITLRNGTVYGPYPVTMQTNNAANVQIIAPDTSAKTVQDLASAAAGKGAAIVNYSSLQTVSQRLADLPSVKDYGAKCDGSTDDSTALQAAIDDMAKKTGHLYIPPGKCNFSTTLNIQAQMILEGTQETTRYFPGPVGGTGPIGSLLYYTGAGIAIDVKNNGGTGAVGVKYVMRVQLRHLRIVSSGAAQAAIRLYNVQESEIDHVNISDAYDAPPGAFQEGIICAGCNTHTSIHDGNIANVATMIDFQFDGVHDGNSSAAIYNMNLFQASNAAVKIQEVSGLEIGPNNWIEGVKNTVLVNNDGVPALDAVVDGLRFYHNAVYNSGSTLYADCRLLKVQHGDDATGIVVHNARFHDNLINSDSGSQYLFEVLYGATVRVQDQADFTIERNDLWGGQTSAAYSDNASKVVWRFRDNWSLNHYWGSPFAEVPEFSGLGTWYAFKNGTYDTNDSQQIKATNYVRLTPGNGNAGVGPTVFNPGGTWHVWNATGATQSVVQGGSAQGTTPPFIIYPSVGAEVFYVRPNGQTRVGADTLANLGVPSKPELIYCSNCNAATNPCTSGGAGAWAFYQTNGNKWVCPF